MGCEHMWLVQFKTRSASQIYQDFKNRYYAFQADDLVLLCRKCHKRIHRLYLPIIRQLIEEAGYKKLNRWTWAEANIMIGILRKACMAWVEFDSTRIK
jgi:hypothetical protein